MRLHVIMFNGPPLVGKDTLALYAQSLVDGARHVKFVSTLKMATSTLLNYPIEEMETHKDDESKRKFGKTIREHIIAIGTATREIYGQDIFGRLLADRILCMPMQTPLVLVSDLGIRQELKPVVDALKPERVSVVRVHQSGRTFDGDCREYISDADACGAKTYDIENKKGDRAYAQLLIQGLVQKVTNR